MLKKIAIHIALSGSLLSAHSPITQLLTDCGIPLLEKKVRSGQTTKPIHYQIIARRQADGSYIKRNPHIKQGELFPRIVVEFFLKTENKTWNGYSLPYDNPYIQFRDNKGFLYHPEKPIWEQEPFLGLQEYPLKKNDTSFMKIIELTAKTFLILEKAWQLTGDTLVDLTLEFGFDGSGNLFISSDLTPDAWNICQQTPTRSGDLTQEFRLPKQQIILWRGSEKDDVTPFLNYLKPFINKDITVTMVTCSLHKDPITAYKHVLKTVQKIPDSVIVSFVGKSNAAGPTLAATSMVPTITVPLSVQEFADDVWSSLRVPSQVPVMTILDQANAALASLQILAIRNPRLYAFLQMQKMSRLQNITDM